MHHEWQKLEMYKKILIWNPGMKQALGYLKKCQFSKETSSPWRLLNCEKDVMAELSFCAATLYCC
jgi:hypothetical protein